ncbi:MAG: hypothetical protein MAG581_02229 [Deltaproteobacteria bacterium]|jgi:hypothetical protein|nr:hypothetical protein [Deltaproteobacteria bacterium]
MFVSGIILAPLAFRTLPIITSPEITQYTHLYSSTPFHPFLLTLFSNNCCAIFANQYTGAITDKVFVDTPSKYNLSLLNHTVNWKYYLAMVSSNSNAGNGKHGI